MTSREPLGAQRVELDGPAPRYTVLNLKTIANDPDVLRKALADRGADPSAVDRILAIRADRAQAVQDSDRLRAERNTLSKQIPRAASPQERAEMVARVKALKEELDGIAPTLSRLDDELNELAASLPNIPDLRVPVGPGEEANVVIDTDPELAAPPADARPHWDLGVERGLLDFERGVKLSGTRFYVMRQGLARLQRALIAFLLDHHQEAGYHELYLPFVVREETLFAAGQLPKFRDNLYRDVEDDVWLVPTAEVPITSFHGGEILDVDALPLRYCAYTPCFRREKISAGKDTRGIKRGHQFDKVELYAFCAPEQVDEEFDRIEASAREACRALGLRSRVKQLCTGDLGFGAERTHDIEVWSPGCGEWLEVSSVSSCGTFQARRANIKLRRARGQKPELLSTLNGSGLGIPRTVIAILETHQRPDGTVVVPEPLRRFVGADTVG